MANFPQWPIAPIEIRDFVYGKLIELSPATLYPGALIVGEKGLLACGLDDRHFGISVAPESRIKNARPSPPPYD